MALSYSEIKLIASRYGSALFDLAMSEKKLEAVEEFVPALEALTADHVTWNKLASNPVISADKKMDAVNAALKGISIPVLLKNFLEKIAENGRLDVLADIVSDFKRRASEHRGELGAEVISAKPLDKKAQDSLKETLKKQSGRDVAVTFRVDAALIGGVIIRSGAKMLDYSLRGRLGKMKESLNQQLMNLPS